MKYEKYSLYLNEARKNGLPIMSNPLETRNFVPSMLHAG